MKGYLLTLSPLRLEGLDSAVQQSVLQLYVELVLPSVVEAHHKMALQHLQLTSSGATIPQQVLSQDSVASLIKVTGRIPLPVASNM